MISLYLGWLHATAQNQAIVFSKYLQSWEGYTASSAPLNTALSYRPNLTTLLYLEYKLWGMNGTYSHILNLVIELLNGLMLGSIVIALSKKSLGKTLGQNHIGLIWGLLSASLFILYPLHVEPVNCMAGIVDPLVTLLA